MNNLQRLSMATAVASLVTLGTVSAAQAAKLLYGYDEPQDYYGAGVMNSFVTLDDNGNPLNVGWAFSEGILDTNKLPAEHSHGTSEHSDDTSDHSHGTFDLLFPKDSSGNNYTVFDNIGLGWQPNGHEPKFAFGAPHFDVHFFISSLAQREEIPVAPDTGPFVPPPPPYQNPDPKFVAQDYVNSGHYAAREGSHWVDDTSAEFSGQPFTKTLVYGYDQNGTMNFMEPMITVDFLKSLQSQGGPSSNTATIKLPTEFAQSGIYPTEYTVSYAPTATDYQYKVTMSGMTYKSATPVPEGDSTLGLLVGALAVASQVKKLKLFNYKN